MRTAALTTCTFGKAARAIRLIDTTGDLRLGVPVRGGARSWQRSDLVEVASADGSFDPPAWKGRLDQPVYVAGRWHRLTVDEAKQAVSAKTLSIRGGFVRVGHDDWSARLVGTKYTLDLHGAAAPVPVLPDAYALVEYTENVAGAKGKAASLKLYPAPSKRAERLKVAAGQTVDLTVGSPLKASLDVNQRSGRAIFSLSLTGAGGRRVVSLTGPDGKRPPAPTFVVRDKDGKMVYKAALTYG
jgi:hypothetical protein